MNIERNFGEYFEYSLHDAKIQKIEHKDKILILYFDYIFSYNDDGTENIHKCKIIFEDTDIDDVDFLVFNDTLSDEEFKGRYIVLQEYIEKYKNSEFEIITETYNHSKACFQGWLWTANVPVHCIMDVYFKGKMLYIVEEYN